MPRLSGRHAMIEQLLAEGTKYIFGNPGTTEQAFIGVASAVAFIIAAACLGNSPMSWQFALIFLISGIAGMIPDISV